MPGTNRISPRGTRRIAGAALVATLFGALACNAVLGIGAATEDQTIPSDKDGSADASGGGDAGPHGTPCDRYCSSIMTNCTGNNQEYLSTEVCLAMCAHFEPGLPDDVSQDSLACRNYHAGAAAGDPNFHCRHAGPLGGGVCGNEPCAPYCLLDFVLCGGLPTPPFSGGESGCRNECIGKFTYLTAGDAGDITLESGNTLNCRLYHLESAYNPTSSSAVTTHCPHTATVSATCQ
jgi:hypothetical protein